MGQYKKILLIMDPSGQESPAYTRAVVLAKRTGAKLLLGLFKPRTDPGFMVRVVIGGMPRLPHHDWLKDRVRQLADQGIAADDLIVTGTPLQRAIVETVIELEPDLVIKDRGAEPLVKRIVGAALDLQLIRLCPAPLLLVNPAAHALPQRVIAAVDPLSGDDRRAVNDRILKAAIDFSLQCDATLSLAYAYQAPPVAPVPEAMAVHANVPAEILDELRNERRQALFDFAREHSVPEDRRYFLDGYPDVAIPRLAQDVRADVVAMGTNYRSGLERLAFGSTAERLLARLSCDLLVVKPEGFEADLAGYLDEPVPAQAAERVSA